MSYRTLSAKPLNKSLKTLLRRTSHIGLGLGAFTPVLALANPTGGQVVAGQASITTPSANGMVVHQGSQSAIINWQQFNIGSGEYVTFQQPSSSSVVLNRVVGGSPTSILGNLNANGQVFLVNTNGVYFGHGASVDAQGFLASSLDINNNDFLAKNYLFNKSGNGSATVVNQGNITTHRGGYVVLAGDYASNEGIISAQSGHVVLAAGAKSTLTLQGNGLVSYVVNGATLSSLAGAANAGQLLADGGTVIMTADVANALKATVVNNTGLIEARSISKNNGDISLIATGGNLVNAGTLNASAMLAGQAGGHIVLKGDGVTNLTNTSKIIASGMGANGGHVELSGNVLNVRGTANLGHGGNLLLDPGIMSISAGTANAPGTSADTTSTGHIGVGFIQTQLNLGNNVEISAAHAINHAGGVTAITAATGAGNLDFKVGSNGHVNMGGVNIAIKGKLTAEMGYGSFGHLSAATVDLTASHSLQLARAVENSHGVITKQSVISTKGAVNITAASNGIHSAEGSGGTSIAIKAKTELDITGDLDVVGNVNLVAGQSLDDNGNIGKGSAAVGKVNLIASHGYATVGQIHANGAITVTAKGGNLNVNSAQAASGGVVLQDSGGVINARSVDATNGNVALVDKTGNVILGDATAQHGNVTVNTIGHTLSFSGEAGLFASHGNILVLAANVTHTNAPHEELQFVAGGTITVDGQISLPGTGDQLSFDAGGNISVDHSILAPHGGVQITGPHLAYTGTGKTFSISAGYGNLTLDASIGSAAKPVGYNVNLTDGGYGLFIEKSIYAGHTAGGLAANITATETGLHAGPGSTGVLVDTATSSGAAPLVLNAAGTVSLTGYDVGVGGAVNSHGGAIGINAGVNVILHATGTASGAGQVGIEANRASASSSTVKHSIAITAGNTINISGRDISIQAGQASADASTGVASAAANVVLKAGNKVALTAVDQVSIGGNQAVASADASGGAVGTATANAAVAIVAGNNLSITAHTIHVDAGYGAARAFADDGGIATAAANTGVQLISTKGSILLTGGSAEGGSIALNGGNDMGQSGYGHAEGSDAGVFSKANATAHGNVTLTAAAAGISLTAQTVDLQAGYGAGLQHNASVSHGDFRNVAEASSGAQASYTATADVSLTAGAAGITITGSHANLVGGGGQLNGAGASAESGAATAAASARVNLTATGNVTLLEHVGVNIAGGYSDAAAARAAADNGSHAKSVAKITADGGVGITGANISVGSGGEGSLDITLKGGSDLGSEQAQVDARTGSASINAKSRVDLVATTGNITLTAAHSVNVQGGSQAGHSAGISAGSPAAGGKATLNVDAGVGLKAAKGSITLAGGMTGGHQVFLGGNRAGDSADVGGYGSGVAALNALSSVSIVAGKNFRATAQNVSLEAGYGAAERDSLFADSNGKAKVNANNSLNIKAVNVTVAAGSGVGISAGSEAAKDVGISAFGAGSASVNANNSVNITATGALKVTAATGGVRVQGGNFEAGSAGISAQGAGKATINANGSLNLKGASVVLSGISGALVVQGGGDVAMAARASAESSGQAVVNANGAVSVTATAGNIGLGGKHFVSVAGGSRAAAGYYSNSNASFTSITGVASGSEIVHRQAVDVHNTEAFALGSHAVAAVNGNAAANLTATGNVVLNQTSAASGSLRAQGGDSAAAIVRTSAAAGGVATVTGTAGLHIKAGASGTVALTGHHVNVRGGHYVAGDGDRASSYRANFQSSDHGSTFNRRSVTVFQLAPSYGNHAGGAASKAVVNGDGTLSIQAGTVNVIGHGGTVSISGGFAAGSHALVSASNGGHASVNGKAGVNIAAQTFTAQAIGASVGVLMGGGFHDAGGASVTGKSGGQAALNVDSSLILTAANVSVTGGFGAEIYAGGHGSSYISDGAGHARTGGNGATVTGSNGGTAQVNANAAVNITVAKNFTFGVTDTSSNSGFAAIRGGNDAGINSQVQGKGGTAALNVSDNVNVTAGGSITISTKAKGANVQISAGSFGGYGAVVQADGSSFTAAKATAAIANSVNLAAKGAVAITANAGDVNMAAFNLGPAGFEAKDAVVKAAHGAASLSVNSGLTVSGAAIKVHAASYTTTSTGSAHNVTHHAGDVNIKTTQYAADAGSASVHAGSAGSASLSVNHGVKFITGGILSLTATDDVTVGGSNSRVASSATVLAVGSGAKAAMHVDESTLLQGNAAVTIAAGADVELGTVGNIGSSADVAADSGGNAAFQDNAELNVVTKGAFTLKAGDEASIAAGNGDGHAVAQTFGPGAQASFTDDGTLNISAKTVAISAGSDISIGDTWGAGSYGGAVASHGGNATFTSSRNVNITAATALSLTLTDKAAGDGSINVSGYGAGYYGLASVHSGGKASFAAHQDVNLSVIAAGGTLTLNAGNQRDGIIIDQANKAGSNGYANALGSGTASYAVTGNINLTAPGAITIIAPHGNVTMRGSYETGEGMRANASHGGRANATVNGNLTVRGTAVKISAGSFTTTSGTLHTVHNHKGTVTLAAGQDDVGYQAAANATEAMANATVNNRLSIVATAGALSVKAAGKLQVNAATSDDNGYSANATANLGGGAALTLNQTALLSGKTGVSLAGSSVQLTVTGSDSNGAHQTVFASHGGKAALTDNETLTIVATNGDVNVTAASGDLQVQGANSLGYNGSANAKHLGAQATYTANGSLDIMGSHVTLVAGTKAAGNISISGGAWAGSRANVNGSFGGSAVYNVVADTNITGRKGVKVAIGSGEGIGFVAGDGAGEEAQVHGAFGGKAKLNTSANVNVSATSPGAAITVTTVHGGEVFIGGGSRIGEEAGVGAFELGSANMTANAGVNLHAAGALNIAAYGGVTIRGAQGGFAGGSGATNSSSHVSVGAAAAGHAVMTVQSLTSLTGSAVTLNAATGSMDIIGGSGEGQLGLAQVHAGSSASAQLNALSAVNVTATKGALTAAAYGGVFIGGGGAFLAGGAVVDASRSDANATLNASETVNLSGANVSVTGQNVSVGAGFVTGVGMSVAAGRAGSNVHAANATANLTAGVNINATGNVTLIGKGSSSDSFGKYGVQLASGPAAGAEENVSGYGLTAKAIANIANDITINAGGAFTAKASVSNLDVLAGSGAGEARIWASSGASATQTVDAGINIKTGGAMALSGKTGVSVRAGSSMGTEGLLIGVDSDSGRGTAKQTLNANVNLAAGGSVTVTAASGSVSFEGGSHVGHPAGPGGQVIRGMFGGTAIYTANAAVSVLAGGNLTVTAKDSIGILGGGDYTFMPVASYGGVAAVNANTGVTVKTGGKLSLTATTGDITVRAGGSAAYLADFNSVTTGSGSHGTAGRAVKANLNTAVDVEAVGSAAAVAGGNILISAGDGALMAVGKYRDKGFAAVGTNWMGGSASLNGNFGVTFKTAKNLTLTAGKSGTGSLAIDALQGFGSTASVGNVIEVRGGSSSAHARLNLSGNALVQAGGNVTISVADNMGVYVGSLADVRADHVFGTDYVVTANANATLKAGGNITLAKIGGGLVVAGAGVNASHSGLLLAEAAGLGGSSSARIAVSENANALISAAGNIATTTAIGGDMSILGPTRANGIILGHVANQTATVSGNVTVNAGGSVTLAVTGDIAIMGPGAASASVTSFGNSAHLSDKVQAKDTISAGGGLTLTAGGNIIVAGGDGTKTAISAGTHSHGIPNSVGFVTALGSADASTTLKAGGNMTLNAGGNLLVRGGSNAIASAKAFGGFNSYTANANANANITAGGNLTVTAGSGATFQGGSNASGVAFALGVANIANATGHADLNLNVGGNLTMTVTGPLNIYGGPLVEGIQTASLAAIADGSHNNATATATAKVNVTAGGNVAITAKGGNLSIAGASSAASFRTVIAGSPSNSTAARFNTAAVNADGSVNIKAKNVTLTATGGGVFVSAGRQDASRSVTAAAGSVGTGTGSGTSHGSRNKASLTANSSVNITGTASITITGTAVSLSGAPSNSHNHIHVGSYSSSATVKQISTVRLSAPLGAVHITPAPSRTTFGSFSSSGYQYSGGVFTNVLSGGAGAHLVTVNGPSLTVHSSPTAFVAPVTQVDLGKLQELSLVTHLVTVLGDASFALMPTTDAFSLSVDRKGLLLPQRTTDFTPAGSGAGSR